MAPSRSPQQLFSYPGGTVVWTGAPNHEVHVQHNQKGTLAALVGSPPSSRPPKKYRSIVDVMTRAKPVVIERDEEDYSNLTCEQCGSGDRPDQLMLCDGCDAGYHMGCVRPVLVRIPIGAWFCPKCSLPPRAKTFSQKKIIDFFKIKKPHDVSAQRYTPREIQGEKDSKRRRRRSLVLKKRRRRLLPFIPEQDETRRFRQLQSLAEALSAHHIKFSDTLTYLPCMAPQSANCASLELNGMQVLSKEDVETMEQCLAMSRIGECAPLLVVYDSQQGFTVEADAQIKDMTFITEYTGDVDFLKNRENDDCDSMMTLLLTKEKSSSLVICPDKRGNIARFISGINNHNPDGKKKQNVKCVRYNVHGECRVFLIATRDIAKGEKLYYDYNGYEHEYPTHLFV